MSSTVSLLFVSSILILTLKAAHFADARDSVVGEYPYHISLQKKSWPDIWSHVCSGGIIHKEWVITSAKYIQGFTIGEIRGVVGLHILSKFGDGTRTIEFVKVISHDGFIAKGNDIALLKLAEEITLPGDVLFLPAQGEDLPDGQLLTVTGWGPTKEDGPLTNTLQAEEVPKVTHDECVKSYSNETIETTMICGGIPENGCPCQTKDAGGPVTIRTEDGHVQLVGIVSWSLGCGRPGYPCVFTYVSRYSDWISLKGAQN